jgi:hypothetical protein
MCAQISTSKSYDVHAWHDDLKAVLMDAALQEKITVFLFNEAQVRSSHFSPTPCHFDVFAVLLYLSVTVCMLAVFLFFVVLTRGCDRWHRRRLMACLRI